MADNKKYYYIRLKENFFDSDEIKLLESIPDDGYKFSNILLKMYLKSLKYNGRLMFNEKIPFNAEMLATVTGHSVGDVTRAIEVFQKFGLIEVMESGEIYMLDIQSFIGKTSTEADRIKAYRRNIENKKQQGVQMYDKRTPEIEIDKELDIELYTEIDRKTEGEQTPPTANYYQQLSDAIDENGFSLVLSLNQKELLLDYVKHDNMEIGVIAKALEEASNSNARTFNYVNGILKSKLKAGITTVAKWNASKRDFQERRNANQVPKNDESAEWAREMEEHWKGN
ncbi:phage replisome organizer N-terminal domain-containing protein [Weissella hellenica]|uniref:phage replisome organizer N-terminal domain-containing protein n=1 Tax=Weissella hellenica TaxID=46256 RepID=UPI003885BA21